MLGAIRRDVAGEPVASGPLGAVIVAGAALAYLGAAVGTRRAARTRA
jgi:hypothetical protein